MKKIIIISLVFSLCVGCESRQKDTEEMTFDEWKSAALAYTNEAYSKEYINDAEREEMIALINKEYNNQYKFDYKATLDKYTCSDAQSLKEVRLYRKAIAVVQERQEYYTTYLYGNDACNDAIGRITAMQNKHDTAVLASIQWDTIEKLDDFTGWVNKEEHLCFTKNDSVFDLITGDFLKLNSERGN
ncbi:MAG: hypothetical protein ACOYJE_06740 [Bacteroidaceae bacterium]|jgi:hypothetical protein